MDLASHRIFVDFETNFKIAMVALVLLRFFTTPASTLYMRCITRQGSEKEMELSYTFHAIASGAARLYSRFR